MPICKKQLHRLIMLVTKLKQNVYPNCSSFVRELRKRDINENMNVLCSKKTIQRDIQTLIMDFHAPIKFDKSRNGYYLEDKSWEFLLPVIDDNGSLADLILGLKVAEQNIPYKIDTSSIVEVMMATQKVTSECDENILDRVVYCNTIDKNDYDTFKIIVDCWYSKKIVEILVGNEKKKVEPHVLVGFDSEWLMCGIMGEDIVCLSLDSIEAALPTLEKFNFKKSILKIVEENYLKSKSELKGKKLIKKIFIDNIAKELRLANESSRKSRALRTCDMLV